MYNRDVKRFFVFLILQYLRFAAKIQIAKIQPKIIGIAGSSGKSSLVSLIGSMLSDTKSVKMSQEKNSETGLPLDILNIHMRDFSFLAWFWAMLLVPLHLLFDWKKYSVYVAEMGIDILL